MANGFEEYTGSFIDRILGPDKAGQEIIRDQSKDQIMDVLEIPHPQRNLPIEDITNIVTERIGYEDRADVIPWAPGYYIDPESPEYYEGNFYGTGVEEEKYRNWFVNDGISDMIEQQSVYDLEREETDSFDVRNLVRLATLHKAAGSPDVTIGTTETFENRAATHYNPLTGMQVAPSYKYGDIGSKYIPELAHHVQIQGQPISETLSQIGEQASYWGKGLYDMLSTGSAHDTRFEESYGAEGTLEHQAHSVIEPSLWEYIKTGKMIKFIDTEGNYMENMRSYNNRPNTPEFMEYLGLPIETVTTGFKGE
tara:strand:- start:761 stop:1687 length:927 start_codon:yes stop_codon:yes gene_type:complete